MSIDWSLHAKAQRAEIIRTIAREQTRECASRWNTAFHDTVRNLPDFPESGGNIPEEDFATTPEHAERLRQTLCEPYRIIYERIGDQIRILAIMHTRMLIWPRDTRWN